MTTPVSPLEERTGAQATGTVFAEAHGKERALVFDAAPYLRAASDADLSVLMRHRFGFSYAEMTEVARWFAARPHPAGWNLTALLTARDPFGSGCDIMVHGEQAGLFLLATRPSWLLREVAIRAQRGTSTPLRLRDCTRNRLEPLVEQMLGGRSTVAVAVERVAYRLAYVLGPDQALGPLTAIEVDQALRETSIRGPHEPWLGLYCAARIPVTEAAGWETDPALRPTQEQLRTLAALAKSIR